jgi:hypothetical protein
MAEKAIYVGAGKKQNGHWIKATLKAEILNPEHWEEFKGNKFIKININLKDEVDKYGKDVSITLDKFKPETKTTEEAPSDDPF